MLLELRIRDYAVVHDARFEGRSGLNVLTGETGAGKSIVVGALSLLLGERASSGAVRTGAEKAVVEAVFDLEASDEARQRLDQLGLDAPDGVLVLRREVHQAGRNRAWVNGSPTTAATVGALGSLFVDLHGQNEHRSILRSDEQREALDSFAEAEELAAGVRRLDGSVRVLRDRAEGMAARGRELQARADFLRFQADEIGQAALEDGEDARLEAEGRRLRHAEELTRGAGNLADRLHEADSALASELSQLAQTARRLAAHDERLESPAAELEEIGHRLEELGRFFVEYAQASDFDPRRADELNARLDLLFSLKRKYGPELHDVIAAGARLAEELQELESGESELAAVLEELAGREEERDALAAELTAARREAAERFSALVEAALPELGFEGASFAVELLPLDRVGAGGAEDVEFRVSLNAGFELAPLRRVASGGEVSRLVLAMESILAGVHRVPTLVFDEIDQGVGGTVAARVAGRLHRVAEHHQVFVVTHLPQIASRAEHHLRVEKSAASGLAETRITVLEGQERVTEIARMLGGDPESAVSREHARTLISVETG